MEDSTLERTLVEFTDTLNVDDLGAFTSLLARRCVGILPITGAAVLLNGSTGKVGLHAVHPEWLRPIPESAIRGDTGPAVDCCRAPVPATSTDVRTSSAWPELSATALAHGITRISTVPLRHRDRRIGVIALYLRTGTLSTRWLGVAQLLGEAASIGLRNWQEHRRLRTLSSQLQDALDSRTVIEQAKGVIAERHRLSVGDAFLRLRRFSRQHRLPLQDVARQVTGSTTAIRRSG